MEKSLDAEYIFQKEDICLPIWWHEILQDCM